MRTYFKCIIISIGIRQLLSAQFKKGYKMNLNNFIKNFFYTISILFLSHPCYGMKTSRTTDVFYYKPPHSIEPSIKKSTLSKNPSIQKIPDAITKAASEKDPLIISIQNAIANADIAETNKLLSKNTAKTLNANQKKHLLEYAQEIAEKIKNSSLVIINKLKKEIELTTNIETKKSLEPVLLSYETRHINLHTIIDALQALQLLSDFIFPKIFFTPQPYNRLVDRRPYLDTIIIKLINAEQEKIYVCCFHLALTEIAQALINAKNRGVSIEVITDKSYTTIQANIFAIKILKDNGITVQSPNNDPGEQMHHKFFIFKKNILNNSLVWTGSYNPTPNGNNRSWDDVVILANPEIVTQYIERFEEIQKRSR